MKSLDNLNYASTLNILEVIKFHNIGEKRLETDFRSIDLRY